MSRAQRGESNLLADMEIASPPTAARNVTVGNFLPQQENFLPQQRWQWGWLLSFSNFLKERYTTGAVKSLTRRAF